MNNRLPLSLSQTDNNALINSYNGSILFRNSLIAENYLNGKGVLYGFAGSAEFINTTIFSNTHPDRQQPVFNITQNGQVNFINAIVWNNCGDEIDLADSVYYTIDHTCFKSDVLLSRTHISDFPQLNTDDYSLYSWSPCINSGKADTTGLGLGSSDLLGNERVFNSIDMGAVEHQREIESRSVTFTMSASSGNNPLKVNFSSSDNNLLWDFDNDGVIDAEARDTSWTYIVPGLHTPKGLIQTEEELPVAEVQYLRIFNSPPELLNASLDTLRFDEDEIDSSLNLYDIFYDPADDKLSVSMLSENINFLSRPDSVLYFVPKENYFGFEEVALTATDGFGSLVSATLPIEVLPVNDPPMMMDFPDTISIIIGEKDSLNLSKIIFDVDNEFSELNIIPSQSELVKVSINDDWLLLESKGIAGQDSISINISDGMDSFLARLLISVLEPLAINNNPMAAKEFQLHQNHPNPFNPTTKINYQIPMTNVVYLEIYNMLGEKVSTLVHEKQIAGYYSVIWNATDFASGIYYYRFQAGNFVEIRKMLLLK